MITGKPGWFRSLPPVTGRRGRAAVEWMDYFSVGIGVADSVFNNGSGPVRFELKVGRIRQVYRR